jgi:hypothetical protein
VVTHLAQVAAFADHHLRVDKAERDGRTVTRVAPWPARNGCANWRACSPATTAAPPLEHARALLRDPGADAADRTGARPRAAAPVSARSERGERVEQRVDVAVVGVVHRAGAHRAAAAARPSSWKMRSWA